MNTTSDEVMAAIDNLTDEACRVISNFSRDPAKVRNSIKTALFGRLAEPKAHVITTESLPWNNRPIGHGSHAHVLLVQQAIIAKIELTKALEAGDRDYARHQYLLDRYRSFQRAADLIAEQK